MHAKAVLDYRISLQNELEQRCQHNPRYSLRSFARDLGLSPGRLSEILRGHCGLSSKTATKIASRLGWTPYESKRFIDLVERKHARSQLRREMASKRLMRYEVKPNQLLHEDVLHTIKDWYHLAILELLSLKGAKSENSWIAQSLEITEMEAQYAIDRLLRLGQLQWKSGKLKPTEDFSATTDGLPSASIRHFHKQILEKALVALHVQNVDERNLSATIMSFDTEKMELAKSKMKEFRMTFNEGFGTSPTSDSVYCLSMQLFRLGHKIERNLK